MTEQPMNAWTEKLLALAETIDRAQQQRRRSTPFLSKPYTYISPEGATCLACDQAAERIQVGDSGRNPISFEEFPLSIVFEPCGHRVSISAEEADPVWSRTEQRSTEPTPLDREQLQPIINALQQREAYTKAGAGILLPPFAPCPTCGQAPAELFVRNHPNFFLEDRVAFGFRPCGHTFTADGEDIYNAYTQARQEGP